MIIEEGLTAEQNTYSDLLPLVAFSPAFLPLAVASHPYLSIFLSLGVVGLSPLCLRPRCCASALRCRLGLCLGPHLSGLHWLLCFPFSLVLLLLLLLLGELGSDYC